MKCGGCKAVFGYLAFYFFLFFPLRCSFYVHLFVFFVVEMSALIRARRRLATIAGAGSSTAQLSAPSSKTPGFEVPATSSSIREEVCLLVSGVVIRELNPVARKSSQKQPSKSSRGKRQEIPKVEDLEGANEGPMPLRG